MPTRDRTTRGAPAEELADRLFERLGPWLGLECYIHYVVDADTADGTLRLAGTAGLPPEQIGPIATLPQGQAQGQVPCGMVARYGQARRIHDVATSDEPGLELIRHLGVSAYVCHPLLDDGEILGTLSFGSRTRTSFTDAEVELLRTASDVLAAVVARELADQPGHPSAVVGQATGIVMERDGLSPGAALEHLRELARRHEVALEVLSGHLVTASSGRAQRCA